MARIVTGALSTLRLDLHIDPQTLDLYGVRELWSTPAYGAFGAYTGSGVKFTLDGSFNLDYSGGNFTVSAGDIKVTNTRNISVVGSGALGYGTGSGGTVTQATSKSTSVTLNKTNGTIVMNNASLAGAAIVSFTVLNSTVALTDAVVINMQNVVISPVTYRVWATAQAGAITVVLENRTGGALAEVVTLNFAVIKAVTS